mgnify:CR=1 FL=1
MALLIAVVPVAFDRLSASAKYSDTVRALIPWRASSVRVVRKLLPSLVDRHRVDFCIVNVDRPAFADRAFAKLGLITTVAAQINLVMLISAMRN